MNPYTKYVLSLDNSFKECWRFLFEHFDKVAAKMDKPISEKIKFYTYELKGKQ